MATRKNKAVWLPEYNRWQIKVQNNGVRKTFTSPLKGRAGQDECHRKADKWLAEGSIDKKDRVADVISVWLSELERTTSFDHHKQYSYYANNYIIPRIGRVVVSELDEQRLQDVINFAHSSAGLSHKTLSNIRGCLNSFIKFCRKNNFTTLTPESLYIPNAAPKGTRSILSPQELRVLFTNENTTFKEDIVPDFFIHAYRTQVLCGLRPGELIGLTKSSDLGYALAVQGSINIHGEKTRGKNDNAVRSIAVSPILRSVLDAQAAMLKAHGIRSQYLFPDVDGKILKEQNYRKHLKRYCEANRITVVTPYELRHTFVSAAKTLPEGIIKSVVGHSQSMDTFGVYSHELTEDAEVQAGMLENIFKKILEKNHKPEKS